MGLLEGRVAIVTGAGSGIGKATALRMSQEGAKMVVVDIVPDAGQETLATIKERGAEGIFIETDVTNYAQVERMVDTVKYNYGQINILHNNVGVGGSKAAHDTTEENWDRIINGCLNSRRWKPIERETDPYTINMTLIYTDGGIDLWDISGNYKNNKDFV